MITSDFARRMARYNHWQNQSLVTAADGLDTMARGQKRGAFFGSITATLNHVLWADRIWMHRLAGDPGPTAANITASVTETADWSAYKLARAAQDRRIIEWSDALTDAAIANPLTWFSGAAQAEITRPSQEIIVHIFNHQTHHRGQVHAMLTAAGAKPADTDLSLMPKTD